MKKNAVKILSALLMLSMVFSSNVFAAEKTNSVLDSFLGLLSGSATTAEDTQVDGVTYQTHVQNKGWAQGWVSDGTTSGTVGEGLRLEGLEVKIDNTKLPVGLGITYQTQIENDGWAQGWVSDGALSGSQARGLRLEGVQIKLTGANAGDYSVGYKTQIQNKGWETDWSYNGATSGTVGEGLRLEAIQIEIFKNIPDLTAYDAAVAQAKAAKATDYTAASYAALQTALTDNVVTDANLVSEVAEATTAINDAYAALVPVTKLASVTATGVKTLTVTFNQAVTAAQQATATVTVKKGSVTTNLDKTAFATDGKSVVLTTASKLTKGTYTVTAVIDGATSTGTVDVVDEKVSAITLTSDKAAQVAGTPSQAYVLYQVTNQYNEKMTGQTITWSQSTGGSVTFVSEGILRIENTTTPSTAFIPGAVVYITGVHAASGTVLNAPVTIGLPSKVDTVDFQGVYNTATKKIEALPAGFAADKYTLLFEAKDQYGNKMNLANFNDLVFTSDNPLFIATPSVAGTDVTLNGTVYESLKLAPGTTPALGGTANVSVISKNTGAKSTYEITADALSMVKTFTMSAPADMIAVGEKIDIPFEAYDQNGVAMTKYSDLNGKVQLTSPTNTTLQFVKNADGTAKLEFSVNTSYTAGIASLTSFVTGQSSFSAITIDVKALATPTVIIGLDPEVTTTVAMGQAFNLKTTDLIYQDQYGRIIPDAKIVNTNTFVRYKTTNMSGVVGSLTEFAYTSTPASITVNASGVQTVASIEFALYTDTVANTGTLKAGSEKAFPITVTSQSDYTSYEVADLGTMYNDGVAASATAAGYNKTAEVYGVKADGTKSLLSSNDYTVTTNVATARLTVSGAGVISDTAGTGWVTATDFTDSVTGAAKTIPVKVTVQIKDTAVSGAFKATIVKDLTVSNAAPTGATITMNDTAFGGKYNTAINTGTTAVNTLAAIAVKEVKDQYGVVMAGAPSVTISNVTKVANSAFAVAAGNITGAVVGDTYTANFTYGTTVYSADFLVNDTDANNQAQLNKNVAATVTSFTATGAVGDIVMPAVPAGYTIAVKTTGTAGVYSALGALVSDGTSAVVYTITNTATSTTADAASVTVTVDVP